MDKKKKIVAITACAAGIAHTYMAADSLKNKAEELGYSIHVETQGTIGIENEIPTEKIVEADVVIIASDVKIDLSRFNGKKVFSANVKSAIKDPDKLIKDAFNYSEIQGGKGTKKGFVTLGKTKKQGILSHLMTGISWMLPLTIASGLLMAVANLCAFQTEYVDNIGDYGENWVLGQREFPNFLMQVGGLGFKLMIPIFAGFVAYSIADRPGLAPALIAGWIINDNNMLGISVKASEQSVIEPGAGFIGAIVVGLLTGYLVKILKSIHWPKFLNPIVPIMIIPIIATVVMASLVKFLIGPPIASLVLSMFDGLSDLEKKFTGTGIVIAIVVSIMIAFDLGGPFNKTALVFGTVVFYQTLADAMSQGLGYWDANFVPGTATQAAISVPPLGMWLSTILFKNKYTKNERVMGKAAFGTGIVGITEGAIPFAASDPIRIIFANICGSVVAAVGVTLWNVQFAAGLGSPIGAFLGYIRGPMWPLSWILPIVLGIVVTALTAGFLKKKIVGEEYELYLKEKSETKKKRMLLRLNIKMFFRKPKLIIKKILKSQSLYWKRFWKNWCAYWKNAIIILLSFFINIYKNFKTLFILFKKIFTKKTIQEIEEIKLKKAKRKLLLAENKQKLKDQKETFKKNYYITLEELENKVNERKK
ncbi:PTS fructose transporter subunit IIC [Spiroplasma turonicum]|uniref:PTS system mannose-specific IIC component n=1 Tax=Spiroplasma turonicum TaxID=216946 RepID=A0A0K1P6N2_9MOLU|nr:fructose-specific PTS transporter subunit EIIC [Spiroplasma turonicum]AKU79940.1 PTS system mannose-specific IIC component [Spiroplasma turonicum]ALX70953.1 PTS system, mannose-specific IIB component [Spiroplasma turonicum]